jgi:hypothetical protein
MTAAWPLSWDFNPHLDARGQISEPPEESVVLFLRVVRKALALPPDERGGWLADTISALPGAPAAGQVRSLPPAVREAFWSGVVEQIAGSGWLDAMIRIGELEAAS